MDLSLTPSSKSANLKLNDCAEKFKKCANRFKCKSFQTIKIDQINKWPKQSDYVYHIKTKFHCLLGGLMFFSLSMPML